MAGFLALEWKKAKDFSLLFPHRHPGKSRDLPAIMDEDPGMRRGDGLWLAC
ncbi:hypothetical protein A11S_1039 [Micavibrio aeruginosavorus EPB]|uniref:Uncharacterized protein n=1 Tax=Micavibrio aeruginosavorus EPB TaxID=349215 RepID=M4VEP1_9BACT|nr:hypothetical protein A11S_1039 [Micavibrio aeruginosavorus EPB]